MLSSRITFIELGALSIQKSGEEVGEVRIKHPKITQLVLASVVKSKLTKEGIQADVNILDLKLDFNPIRHHYKTIKYGNYKLDCGVIEPENKYLQSETENSNFICISANLTSEANIFKRTVKKILKFSKAKIIVGGNDASLRPTWYLSNGAHYVVIGEGEKRLPKLILSILLKKDISNVNGIAYKKGNKLMLETTNPTEFVSPDDIPIIDFSLVNLKKYDESYEGPLPEGVKTPIMFFETSRGCWHNCPNCTIPNVKGPYRVMSRRAIKMHLDHYKKNGIKTLLLIDDNLLIRLNSENGRDDLFWFFDFLRRNNFAWEFPNGIEFGQFYKNKRIDEEFVKLVFSSKKNNGVFTGCYRAYIPLETFDPELKQQYPKLPSFPLSLDLLKSIIKTKIPFLTLGIMIFGPEDNSTIERMHHFNDKIRRFAQRHNTQISWDIFSVMPIIGTLFYNQTKKNKLLVFSADRHPELYNFYFCVFNSDKRHYIKTFSLINKLRNDLNHEKFE